MIKALLSVALAVTICVLLLVFARSARTSEAELEVERKAHKYQIQGVCREALGQAIVVETLFQRNEPRAKDAAKDFLTYGLPWMKICLKKRPEVLDIVSDDGARLQQQVHQIRKELEGW